MVGFRDVRGSLRYSVLVSLVGLGACTSVLGIEDLHQDPRPGSAGTNTGASSNNGGSKNQGGSQNQGGNGATDTGGTNTDAGTGNQPSGGKNNGGNGGASNGGTTLVEAGAGGEPVNVDPTVHGTLIDFWGHPLSNIIVTVAGNPVPTDKDGKFTAENVPAEYDATLRFTRDVGSKQYGWAFVGLTRRDPTLQVYQALDDNGTSGYVKVTGPALGPNDTATLSLGIAGGNSRKTSYITLNDANGNYFDPEWQGPTQITGTLHGLTWTNDGTSGLPASYKAYNSALLGVAQGTAIDVTLNLSQLNPAGAAISGSVTPFGNDDRNNSMFVRFDSGAGIQVVDTTPTMNAFSYIAPTLPKSSITIAASNGGSDVEKAFGLAHKDGMSPGAAAGTLKIPAPATPLTPNSADVMVDETTDFSFSGSADSKGAFVVHMEATQFYDSFYVVTSKKKFKIPDVPGFSWVSGHVFYWRIETHGDFATVDAMTGPNGFADEFTDFGSYYAPQPCTHQGDGSYTRSAMAYFTRK